VNIIILVNGQDVTDSCLLSATRIAYDSTKRITTASISIMAQALNRSSRYDYAHYDQDTYSIALRELYEVTILDGRDGTTKLFDGNIYAMTLAQSDTPGFSVFYQCDLNDWSAWLDRAVCWDTTFALSLPNSDQNIIYALLGHFCPKITLTDVASLVPVIEAFDFATKTCRQVLDDLSTLSMGTWLVDFDGNLHYKLASAAPPAPFNLSTSPDFTTTFPVRVENYKHDFTNPVNHAYVRGTVDPTSGAFIEANYADPVSIGTYGEYAAGIVDTQIITAWDAALRAKSTVLTYAYPIESGSFKIWGPDGLQCGMQVHITEENLGIDGDYTVRALTMYWEDKELVRYEAQFGALQPDLETILRMISQRTLWQTSQPQTAPPPPMPPAPGSVTDASIAAPGLSASSIQSVNATSIMGLIQAGQIGGVYATTINGLIQAGQIQAVNASAIVGTINSGQIGSVSAGAIQGVITAGQIGSVNATTIQGVVVSSQLADGIVDDLAKYATALRPVPMIQDAAHLPSLPNDNFPAGTFFYYVPDGHFYQITSNGLGWVQNDSPQNTTMSFYYIGAMSAQSIIGLIVAAQIQSITAGQITGQIQAAQVGSVNASTIVGQITSGQITNVNASQITGAIQAGQIASISAGQITGTISAAQIQTVNATQITGTLAYNQIGSINASTITIGQLQDTQIAGMSGAKLLVGSVDSDKFNGYSINVGGLGNMPGRINVYSGTGLVAQMGTMDSVGGTGYYGGWFQTFGAGGTAYSNAPIYTDLSGNLYIRNSSITNSTVNGSTISNPSLNVSGQIQTSPTTFDNSYGTLALQNTSGTDSASFISRGLVIYSNGQKVGSVVRSPYGSYMAVECSVGPAYVLIDGQNGVRSDAGYLVGGNRVINSSGQFIGQVIGSINTSQGITTSSTLQASGGIYTGSGLVINSAGQFVGTSVNVGGTVNASAGFTGGAFTGSSINTSGTCNASGGYTGGVFQGSGVLVSGGCGAAGFNPTGYNGQNWTIAFHDNAGNPLELWINGVNQGQVQLRVVGGVIVGTA
jgi:hypothetical protein